MSYNTQRNIMETISFEDLGLTEETLAAIEAKGFETPSPIQVLAIPRLLNGDANVVAKARTGTGKTAAFGIPLVQTITQEANLPQALVLTPTRELALQVCKEIQSFTTNRYPRLAAVYGGQSMGEQLRALKRGVEIVVGTPGRVKDHLERGTLKLDDIKYFVLDEADEMLNMGFIEDIEHIFSQANPTSRVLLFSATMPPEILKIAGQFMGDYEIVEEETRPEEPILTEQKFWMVRENEKIEALVRLIDISPDFYGLVFTQTKSDADMVAKQLDERGYEAVAMHGDIPQAQREKILQRFRTRKTRILVATDVAARGIDIEGLSHVVNYSLPFDPQTYIHRIGRTGRAGAKGIAFTLVRPEERRKLEFLKSATKKATKGSLTEETIPSIKQVLAAKKERLFTEMKQSLGFTSEIAEDSSDILEDSQGEIIDQSQEPKEKTPESFVTLAKELCENRDAQEVLAAVLALSYGRALNPDRYGSITPIKTQNQDNQIRLYVGLGRRDGFNPREIASYFSQLLRIPQRLVDRIDVADNFSLVSLPRKAALDVLERSRRDRNLPHIHIDSKNDSYTEKSSRGRKGDNRNKSFGRGKDRFFDDKARNSKKSNTFSNDANIRRTKTSNAGLYRKSQNKKTSGNIY